MQISLYIAASLDGFIARRDGSIDWLSAVEAPGEDYGYQHFYVPVDAVAIGRSTYDLCLTFPEWPYSGKKTYVFTNRTLRSDRNDVEFVSGDPAAVAARMRSEGFKNVWLVGGGVLIQSFRQASLIDEYVISIIPVLLGDGLPMFPSPSPEERLELRDVKSFPSGLVQIRYVRS